MPRPVSIIVWRDAKSDPPTGRGYYLADDIDGFFLLHYDPEDEAGYGYKWSDGMGGFPDVRQWAELPVVSDLTDEDVRNVALWALDGEVLATGTHNAADRLRAALGGEKEEA